MKRLNFLILTIFLLKSVWNCGSLVADFTYTEPVTEGIEHTFTDTTMGDTGNCNIITTEWFIYKFPDYLSPIYSTITPARDSIYYTFNDGGTFKVCNFPVLLLFLKVVLIVTFDESGFGGTQMDESEFTSQGVNCTSLTCSFITPNNIFEGSNTVFTSTIGGVGCHPSYLWKVFEAADLVNPININTTEDLGYTFLQDGDYFVILNTTDEGEECGSSSSFYVGDTVPDVDFDWSPIPTYEGDLITFNDMSFAFDGIKSRYWDFDGLGNSNISNPTFTFNADGVYTIGLTVTDNDDSLIFFEQNVTVLDAIPNVDFDWSPTTIYEGDLITFNDMSSAFDGIKSRFWNFDGLGNSNVSNPTFTFNADGVYTIGLTVIDNDDSQVYLEQKVTILDTIPDVDFDWSPTTIYEGDLISFNDMSSAFDGIKSRFWDFDGLGNSNISNPTFTFNADGVYTIGLTVTDNDDSQVLFEQDVTILDVGVTAEFSFDPITQFEGQSIDFTDESIFGTDTAQSYLWDFGGIDTSTESNPTFSFQDNGVYNVTLTVTDSDNSVDTVTHEIVILDVGPIADFTFDDEPVEGSTVIFNDNSTSFPDVINQWDWDFDGLGDSTDQNPSFQFVQDGEYNVTLTVTDDDGSTDTIMKTIRVLDSTPIAYFDVSNLNPNEGELLQFWDDSTSHDGITTRTWQFGNEHVEYGNLLDFNFTFKNDGTYTVTLTVQEIDGDEDSYFVEINVGDLEPQSCDFSWLPESVEEGSPIQFTSVVSSYDNYTVHFDFGVVGTSTEFNPEYTFVNDGVYNVTMTISDKDGDECSVIYSVTILDLSPVCDFTWLPLSPEANEEVQFSDSTDSYDSISTYSWDFGDESETSSENNPSYTYTKSGTFTVSLQVTDDDGSIDSRTYDIEVKAVSTVTGDVGTIVGVIVGVVFLVVLIIVVIIVIVIIYLIMKRKQSKDKPSSEVELKEVEKEKVEEKKEEEKKEEKKEEEKEDEKKEEEKKDEKKDEESSGESGSSSEDSESSSSSEDSDETDE